MRYKSIFSIVLIVSFFVSVTGLAQEGQMNVPADLGAWNEEIDGPLPHWGDFQRPEHDPDRPLHPYAVHLAGDNPPTSGVIDAVPEYAPSEGIIFRYSTGAWPQVVTACVAAITGDPAKDDKVFIVVANASQQNTATNQFVAAGADMSKVEFSIHPSDTIWLRDYGPAFILLDGGRAIVDSHYYLLNRLKDNFIPCLLAEDFFQVPVYHGGYVTSAGGNFLPGPGRSAFVSEMVYSYNPDFTQQYVHELYQEYQGIDTLHVLPDLPQNVDLTGHIDMWMYLVDDDSVIISEFVPGSDPTAIQITENAVPYMQNLGFEVFRVPDHNGPHPSWPGVDAHYTYTNSIRINDRILIPSYAEGDPAHAANDALALAGFQAAAPDCEIIQIPCYDIIWAAGAIHCMSMNVPKGAAPDPVAHVVAPNGGDICVSGSEVDITWASIDDIGVSLVDLFYSTDNGVSFPHAIATGLANDCHETWTVPELPAPTTEAMVRVVAHDGDGNFGEDVSNSAFQIRDALRTVYDFSENGGIDRWGWGPQVSSWSDLEGVRYPASAGVEITEFDRDAYGRLAFSDATGGDADPNRYISPQPSGVASSAHIFEFVIQEERDLILDIGIEWEGYADSCGHIEMYVWDNVAGNWGDGAGNLSDNHFMDNFAGNRDDVFHGSIHDQIDRYIDVDGKLTLLLYSDRNFQKTFHDFMAVTITSEFMLSADAEVIPEAGGTVNFTLQAGVANADRKYMLVGGANGEEPGLPLPGGHATLPVNWDWFSDLEMALLNTIVFHNFLGTLDGSGTATAQLNIPALPPGSAGPVLTFAYCCDAPFDVVSNPVSVEVVE